MASDMCYHWLVVRLLAVGGEQGRAAWGESQTWNGVGMLADTVTEPYAPSLTWNAKQASLILCPLKRVQIEGNPLQPQSFTAALTPQDIAAAPLMQLYLRTLSGHRIWLPLLRRSMHIDALLQLILNKLNFYDKCDIFFMLKKMLCAFALHVVNSILSCSGTQIVTAAPCRISGSCRGLLGRRDIHPFLWGKPLPVTVAYFPQVIVVSVCLA